MFFRNSSSGSLPQHPHGFESDYPMGGTIKKRPSIIGTHPKLPLTNTTRGLVRDSEDDSSSIGKFEKTFLEDREFLENSAVIFLQTEDIRTLLFHLSRQFFIWNWGTSSSHQATIKKL